MLELNRKLTQNNIETLSDISLFQMTENMLTHVISDT